MSKQREAMEMALDALEDIFGKHKIDVTAINMLREALAEPEQAPVAWLTDRETIHFDKDDAWRDCDGFIQPLYTAPPARKPVAWMYHGILHNGTPHDRPSLIWRPEYMDALSASMGAKATPLYTAPPARKPLTDERIDQIIASNVTITDKYLLEAVYMAIREVEQEHGIGEA